jgi:hypothetical protein
MSVASCPVPFTLQTSFIRRCCSTGLRNPMAILVFSSLDSFQILGTKNRRGLVFRTPRSSTSDAWTAKSHMSS